MIRFVLVCCTVSVAGVLRGESLSFDFDGGLGQHFDIVNDSGLWNFDTAGTSMRIHKPADDGSTLPTGFVRGKVRSRFTIDGDFSVTVDFAHNDFPISANQFGLNESILAVVSESDGLFEILRFNIGDGREFIETFTVPPEIPGFVVADERSDISQGRYRLMRADGTISGWYALDGVSDFQPLGSLEPFLGPVFVELTATQGTNRPDTLRSMTAMDIGFDNLVIDADAITVMPPIWGDTNNDGMVSLQDLNNIRNHFGDGVLDGPPVFGEAYPFDGIVDIVDLNFVLNRFGTTAFSPVTEPWGLAMLLTGGVVVFLFRRPTGRPAY